MNSEQVYANTENLSPREGPTMPSSYSLPQRKTYRVQVLITEEDDRTWSVIALSLPGTGSCGDTQEEAIQNAKEAIAGALEEYEASGMLIPWQEVSPIDAPPRARKQWIMVNV